MLESNAKIYLRKAVAIEREIKSIESHILKLHDKPNHADSDIAKLRYTLEDKRKQLVALHLDIEKTIDTLQDGTLRTLIRNRYINNMTWIQIAGEMNYSERQVHNLHGIALEAIKIALNCSIGL